MPDVYCFRIHNAKVEEFANASSESVLLAVKIHNPAADAKWSWELPGDPPSNAKRLSGAVNDEVTIRRKEVAVSDIVKLWKLVSGLQ